MANKTFSRNIGAINEKEQLKLGTVKVCLVGIGGVGSPAFEIFVRIGIKNFIVFDKDKFEKTNFNRQIYSSQKTLGKFKVNVAVEKANAINPSVKIEKYAVELNEKTIFKLKKCNIVVDGTDNIPTRKIIAKFCRKNKIPYVFCSAGNTMGMISVFIDADFDKIFKSAREPKRKRVIAPVAMLAGSILASQAIAVLLGKEFVKAPEFLFFDIFSKRFCWKQKI